MGAIGGLLGTAGGASGTGFSGPKQAQLPSPVTTDQGNQGYQGAQQGLASQQALLAALQGKGGLSNQGYAYNQTKQLTDQLYGNNGAGNLGSVYNQGQGLANQLAGAGAVGNQSQALAAQQALAGQQQATAQQYQNIANGTGPNPAQAALNQSTGQNVANQAALMAGQRGAGANVGLLARQAAQQGAATQQEAVGQSATLQAQQQMAGLSGLSAQQAAIGNTNQNVAGIAGQQLAAQQAQQQALASQAGQQVSLQQASQAALAGQANQQVANQIGATTALSQGQQAEQQALLGAQGQYNATQAGQQANVNTTSGALAGTQMKGQQDLIGGLLQGAGVGAKTASGGGLAAAAPLAAAAEGGDVQSLPVVPPPSPVLAPAPQPPSGPTSSFGQFLTGRTPIPTQPAAEEPTALADESKLKAGSSAVGKGAVAALMAARGGMVPAMVSEAEVIVPPKVAQSPRSSADFVRKTMASGGGVKAKTPDEKAVKKGNSYDNDKIPTNLPEGSIVIPRSVMQSKDPARSAADFVAKVMAKRGRSS